MIVTLILARRAALLIRNAKATSKRGYLGPRAVCNSHK